MLSPVPCGPIAVVRHVSDVTKEYGNHGAVAPGKHEWDSAEQIPPGIHGDRVGHIRDRAGDYVLQSESKHGGYQDRLAAKLIGPGAEEETPHGRDDI